MMKFNSEQSGRSMVEMLGVLAIIGVLSVAGIAGYSKAMAKYKVSKAIDQVSTVVANIRTAYASQASYDGLDNAMAISLGLVGKDMAVGTSDVKSPYGDVTIEGSADGSFTYQMDGVPQDACINIATSDWGLGTGGLQSLVYGGTSATNDIPTLSSAASACNGGNKTIIWTYR